MVIVVTGTVAPRSDQRSLKLVETEERLWQYKNALEKLILAEPNAKIVFAENSGYGKDGFEDMVRLASEHSMKLEVLSFSGNHEAVVNQGKGYGEGEILQYVLENSQLVKGEKNLLKITGRLTVDNIAKIVRCIRSDRVYFNVPNIHRKEFYDTRMYAMPVDVFKNFFKEEYKKVHDSNGYFLELAYTDAALRNGLHVYNFPSYPRIVGVSGSSGTKYEYTEWKSKIRDFISLFNIYGKTTRREQSE